MIHSTVYNMYDFIYSKYIFYIHRLQNTSVFLDVGSNRFHTLSLYSSPKDCAVSMSCSPEADDGDTAGLGCQATSQTKPNKI